MHNVATIYRFYSPFLDFSNEKKSLILLIRRIQEVLVFDSLKFKEESFQENNFYNIILKLEGDIGKIELGYLTDLGNKYYTPIFKLNIFLNQKFLLNNDLRKKAVKFLNNIFECFDGLDEKEFLIDLNNELYYEKGGFFSKKVFPHYDFSDIGKIEKLYDEGKGVKILEDFIKIFQNKTLVIDQEKASYYHKIHSCFLYFIYLVFLISQNLEKINSLDFNICENSEYKAHLDLTEKRVSYIKEVEKQVFDKYVRILEIFFGLF